MTRTILAGLPRRAATAAVCIAAAVGVTGAVAAPAWADTIVSSAHTTGVSAGVEDYVYASVVRDSSGRIYAHGYDIELHDYQANHYIDVTLEERNAAGGWVVVAEAPGDKAQVEGADGTTATHANDGTFRACSAAHVVEGGVTGATITVCTA
jgi:hypothetical protein